MEPQAHRLREDIIRIQAPNPGPMTYTGTNTYLVGQKELALIDPGPNIDRHLDAINIAKGPSRRIRAIIVTHSHIDHSELAPRAAELFDAPIYAFGPSGAGNTPFGFALEDIGGGEGTDDHFKPDFELTDGQTLDIGGAHLRGLWTPGHFGNHMCFEFNDALFSGDLVMGWSTSLVSPPDGDMGQYMASLRQLKDLEHHTYFPGHGPEIVDPPARLDELIGHRLQREKDILAEISQQPKSIPGITRAVYKEINPKLLPIAERNVLAHLIDLFQRGLVNAEPTLGQSAKYIRS